MTKPVQQPEFVIRIRNLVKIFDERMVLDDVNLDIRRGETMVILGGSGSGKSTMLRVMIGSLLPNQGTVELLGHNTSQMDISKLNEIRKKIGVLFQSGALFNSMTLRQNVALPLQEHTNLSPQTIDIVVKIKLEMVGLREHADKYPAQISGGMKKRAGLARALALDPQILFYDEPSAGLDPVTSAEIDQLILSLTKQLGVTSIVVTHEMDSAFTIADRMAMLDHGRMLAIDDRQYFDRLRHEGLDPHGLSESESLIRQFLRGDFHGPMTQRKQATDYQNDLLGALPARGAPHPAIRPTR